MPTKKTTKKTKKESSIGKRAKRKSTLDLKTEREIAMDFGTKIYQKFEKAIKAVVLFGSTARKTQVAGSDIDLIIIVDDASIRWDTELIMWYREELDKMLRYNPYIKSLHINTVKLTTWWEDLLKGDPVVINVLRYGEAMIDLGGFFNPLKALLMQGKIRSTPESIYGALQRAPMHLVRSKNAELQALESLYWSMVDSAHAALMAANISPPSPEHIGPALKENFSLPGRLKPKYVAWFNELHFLHKKVNHGEIEDLKGVQIDDWQKRAEEFLQVMTLLTKELVTR